MKTYLISYDLIKPESGPDYVRVIGKIKSLSLTWAKPLESVWIIKADRSRADLMSELRTVMHPNCKILIIEVTNDWISLNLPQEVVDWMRSNT